MKVAIATYPMLWQRTGGLQVQIRKTIEHLRMRGVEVHLFDALNEKLRDCDLVHVFAAINGGRLILQSARAQGVRTVLSSLLQPEGGRLKFLGYEVASWLTGKLSSYEIRTTHDEIRSAVKYSDRLIALSDAERRILCNAYGASPKEVTLIPNGIDSAFFSARPSLFSERFAVVPGFILVVGTISPYKNQLGVVRATARAGRPVVLIGPVGDKGYLQQCLHEGGARVCHLGVFAHDDPLLGSAYAAAGVTVLASAGETFGLAAVESLAAGTPTVITSSNGLGLEPVPPLLTFVNPRTRGSIERAVDAALTVPLFERERCSQLVKQLEWSMVAEQIEHVYQKVLCDDAPVTVNQDGARTACT